MALRLRLTAAALVAAAAAVALLPPADAATPTTAVRQVIVIGASTDAAAAAVADAGGTVWRRLDLIDGVEGSVPAGADVRGEVIPDVLVPLAGARYGQGGDTTPTQVVAVDPGTLDGRGVTVALIDTGVADVPALEGRTELGPDFTDEADGVDRYGHGTFMAGLIAGRGVGVAQGATVLSIKVAGAEGEAQLSDLLAAMEWVHDNREDEHIDVLNLSFGVLTPKGAQGDPLVRAAEAIEDAGIAVVAAAGNEGTDGVTSPGKSWAAITVGASDTHGTPDPADDTVAPWSGRGKVGPFDKPDVVAPGVDIVSVRAPGSTIDEEFAHARVGDDQFRGSGTSMSAAIVSGALAAVLAVHPDAEPADVKMALIDTANPIDGGASIDIVAAATGEPREWAGARWAGARWAGARWAGARWAGARWAGARWAGARWAGARWAGARWADSGWAGARWAGARWAASIW